MPHWSDGLVDAFPVPEDTILTLNKLKIDGGEQPSSLQVTTSNLQPLPFFDFPAEIRNRIYDFVLFSKPDYRRVDGTRRGSRLAILLASKRFHQEASYTLYTTQKFLVFPLQEFTPTPLVQDLPVQYRTLVTRLEMKVGSDWTRPPKSWKVTTGLERCFKKLKNVQTLIIFVEFDPSQPVFKVKPAVHEAYVQFCSELVRNVLGAMSKLKYVQLDGNPGVEVHGALVSALRRESHAQNKTVTWGTNAGWAYIANAYSSEFL